MKAYTLADCPFCLAVQDVDNINEFDSNGGPMVVQNTQINGPRSWVVKCRNCRAKGPFNAYANKQDAIKLWNERLQKVPYECNYCGGLGYIEHLADWDKNKSEHVEKSTCDQCAGSGYLER